MTAAVKIRNAQVLPPLRDRRRFAGCMCGVPINVLNMEKVGRELWQTNEFLIQRYRS